MQPIARHSIVHLGSSACMTVWDCSAANHSGWQKRNIASVPSSVPAGKPCMQLTLGHNGFHWGSLARVAVG